MDAVFNAMDAAILKTARCDRNKIGKKKFWADIIKHVDAGIPLAWGIVTGKVDEKPPTYMTSGSHMRIIFGYNNASNELLYTDSWGAGHARKTMSIDDAWTITDGLYVIEPNKKQ